MFLVLVANSSLKETVALVLIKTARIFLSSAKVAGGTVKIGGSTKSSG